ncbi:MAG TPA: tol-pal system-associated acyl-CoA thioesterase [Terriglobia bacterium]|nr:tol-pal system-associated acyl-CoA thioesterase [Terriglobia bacterium]
MHETNWTSTAAAFIHRHSLRVYIEDTDSGGIVYYANYLRYAERGRTEMLRSVGISHAEMIAADHLVLAVRRCEVDYLLPAKLDDALVVESQVTKIGGASLTLAQRICRDGVELVTLVVIIVCINAAGRATRLPDRMRQALQGIALWDAGSETATA